MEERNYGWRNECNTILTEWNISTMKWTNWILSSMSPVCHLHSEIKSNTFQWGQRRDWQLVWSGAMHSVFWNQAWKRCAVTLINDGTFWKPAFILLGNRVKRLARLKCIRVQWSKEIRIYSFWFISKKYFQPIIDFIILHTKWKHTDLCKHYV